MVQSAACAEWHALKEQGNELFTAGEHLKAAAMFTSAIKSCPGSEEELAVLYRCLSRASPCLLTMLLCLTNEFPKLYQAIL